ncbi:hypothetical protein BKH46_08565 [Helicobacter sp. 12S02634-8]|nr:hypothetical protein BKH46_08565 [Helicobacter sp. 12S02634-8]
MPKNKAFVLSSFYRPIVYERIDGKEARQMAALTIKLDVLFDIIGDIPTAGTLVENMEHFYNRYIDFEQVAFGASKCREYWLRTKNHKVVMLKI